jgi:hypothetical protein
MRYCVFALTLVVGFVTGFLIPVVSDLFVNGRPVSDLFVIRRHVTPRYQVGDPLAEIARAVAQLTRLPTPPPKITQPPAPAPKIPIPLTPDPSIKERRDAFQQIVLEDRAASLAYVGCLDRSAEESETRRKVDDDAEVARGLMASCAFEFWAYVIANSRVLDVVRAHSLQLDDELARSQKVAKALRERYYLIAIGMVQQIRNRDQQIPRDPWSRDEKNCPWSGYGIAQHALLRFWREAGELKPNYVPAMCTKH